MLSQVIQPVITPVINRLSQAIKRGIWEPADDVGGFSPTSLFVGGVQGWWYDFSDMSTLFQDSAGSTPVTAVEQPIGRVLDKSGNGNHSIQATSSLKPTLSARKNLYTKSEDLTAGIWATAGTPPTITANATVAPDGTTTADQLAFSVSGSGNRISQSSINNYTGAMVVSIYLKGAVGGEAIRLWDGQATTTVCTLTTEWQRFQVTATYSAQSVNCLIYANSGTPTIFAWGAQLEGGSVATSYQWIDTASSYNSVGFPMYARFDGVDDFMQSASAIAWGSDKASVFTGITKNPVSSNTFWVDFGARAIASFELGSLNPATPRPFLAARGSGSTWSAFANTETFNGNLPTYHSGLFDIAGATLNDAFKRRTNGTANTIIQNDAGSIGTGNFGTHTLRLGGSVGLHNGAMYQSIAVNKTASATEITSSEAFISKKLGLS